MNLYVTQLKRSIAEKLQYIDDAEYLSSLDAILTYESYAMKAEKKKTRAWMERFLRVFRRN
jgi:hypothetical protein